MPFLAPRLRLVGVLLTTCLVGGSLAFGSTAFAETSTGSDSSSGAVASTPDPGAGIGITLTGSATPGSRVTATFTFDSSIDTSVYTVFLVGAGGYGTGAKSTTTLTRDVTTADQGYQIRAYVSKRIDNNSSTTVKEVRLGVVQGGTITPAAVTFKNSNSEHALTTPHTGDVLSLDDPNLYRWAPSNQGTITYQWKRNGQPIDGATGATYTLTDLDVGTTISAATTDVIDTYGSATVESQATAVVLGNTVGAGSQGLLTGTPMVDQTLHATPGADWTPANLTFHYTWMRDGVIIPKAPDSPDYAVAAADLGHVITAEVTGSRPLWTDTFRTETLRLPTGDPIQAANLTASNLKARLSGTPRPRQTLRATLANAPVDTEVTYQWLVDGEPVFGATKQTFLTRWYDAGSEVSVLATITKPGYTAITTSSSPQTITDQFIVNRAPRISGTPGMGRTLTLIGAQYGPTGAFESYQWYRDGHAIHGATDTTYQLTPKDASHTITAGQTIKNYGFDSLDLRSTGITLLKALTTSTPTVTGSKKMNTKLIGHAGTWGPETVQLTYQWYRDGHVIRSATSSNYTLRDADRGTKLVLRVTGTKRGYYVQTKASTPISITSKP
jgi:hypothetical protein